jgi:hypothetical protein
MAQFRTGALALKLRSCRPSARPTKARVTRLRIVLKSKAEPTLRIFPSLPRLASAQKGAHVHRMSEIIMT